MITINLLPKHLRKTEKKAIALPYNTYILIAAAVFIVLHLLFFGLASIKKIQLVSLKGSVSKISEPAAKAVKLKGDVKALESRSVSLKDVLSRKFSYSRLFPALSSAVPKGLWLDRLSLSKDGLVLQGTVISLSQNEMTIIGKFLQNLKNSADFDPVFSKVELGSVQRRSIKNYDVVDFVLKGEIKK